MDQEKGEKETGGRGEEGKLDREKVEITKDSVGGLSLWRIRKDFMNIKAIVKSMRKIINWFNSINTKSFVRTNPSVPKFNVKQQTV